jgi:hypothetical protein
MRRELCLCVVLLLLLSGRVCAMKEDTAPADAMVIDKVMSDARAIDLKRGHEQEGARRAAAEKKVEALRNIPPERVQEWIDGRLPAAELEKMAALPQKKGAEGNMTLPRARRNRLALLSVATLILAIFYGVQRRRTQKAAATKSAVNQLSNAPHANAPHRTWTIER